MHNQTKQPVLGLKNFAGKVIDYAGIYPPANLDLAQAFHNYLFYRLGENKWMLNKFVIPAKKLADLTKIIKEVKIDAPVSLSIIGSGGDTITHFNKGLSDDVKKINDFLKHNNSFASVDVYEVRLPVEVLEQEEADDMLDLMISSSGELDAAMEKEVPVFYEAALDEKYEATILKVVENIASLNNRSGYKLRTGGTEASAFPTNEQIAFAIMTCCEFNVPMKCTAGMHHPVRHFNEEVNCYMHGFLNVFGAGILAYASNLDEMEILEVLNDEDPDEFMFEENGFEWNDIEVTNEEIRQARSSLMVSFGSCSFDEPVNDLKVIGLL
ncbi:MAG TPA: hypothetical protein VGK25_09845 [Ignavibacteria bacterium]|jgi:hypothetical protein